MSSLLIPVKTETQIYFENECVEKGYTFEIFLQLLVDDYKNKKQCVGIIQSQEKNSERKTKIKSRKQ
jgi:hypothetical protein